MPSVRLYGDPAAVAKTAVEDVRSELTRKFEEALDGAIRILDAAKNRALAKVEKEIGEILREAEERVRAERATREAELRVEELNAKNEWIEKAVSEALRRLRSHVGDETYSKFLADLIQRAAEALREKGEMIIEPTSRDRDLIERLVSSLQLPVKVTISSENVDGYGGFIASSPDGSIRLDYRIEYVLADVIEQARAAAAKALFG